MSGAEVFTHPEGIWSSEVWRERPPIGVKAVLGHSMCSDTYSAYKAVQLRYCEENNFSKNNSISSIAEVTQIHGCPEECQDLAPTFLANFAAEVDNAIAVSYVSTKSLLRNFLPIDIPCCPLLEVYKVGKRDPRQGLRGQFGVRVRKSAPSGIKPGTFIGIYRGQSMLQTQFNKWKLQPPPDMNLPAFEMLVDSYTANTMAYNLGTWASSLQQPCEFPGMNRRTPADNNLYISAAKYGNLTCVVNDANISPLDQENYETLEPNVCLIEVVVGAWPLLVMFAMKELKPGEDLRYHYGDGFWSFMQDNMLRLQQWANSGVAGTTDDANTAATGSGNGANGNIGTALGTGEPVNTSLVRPIAAAVSGDACGSEDAAERDPHDQLIGSPAATEVVNNADSGVDSTPMVPKPGSRVRDGEVVDTCTSPKVLSRPVEATPVRSGQRTREFSWKTPQGMHRLSTGLKIVDKKEEEEEKAGGGEVERPKKRRIRQPDFDCAGPSAAPAATAAAAAAGKDEIYDIDEEAATIRNLQAQLATAQKAVRVAQRKLDAMEPLLKVREAACAELRPPPEAAEQQQQPGSAGPSGSADSSWTRVHMFGVFMALGNDGSEVLQGPFHLERLERMLENGRLPGASQVFIHFDVNEEKASIQEVLEAVGGRPEYGYWSLGELVQAAHPEALLEESPNRQQALEQAQQLVQGRGKRLRGEEAKRAKARARELALAEGELAKANAEQERRAQELEEKKKELAEVQLKNALAMRPGSLADGSLDESLQEEMKRRAQWSLEKRPAEGYFQGQPAKSPRLTPKITPVGRILPVPPAAQVPPPQAEEDVIDLTGLSD